MSGAAPPPPVPQPIVDAVKSGECILFLGAGVHFPPRDDSTYAGSYPESKRPPLGGALARLIAEESYLADDPSYTDEEKEDISGNLQRVSLYFELKRGRPALVDLVRREVTEGKEPSRVVRALAELDFPIICTTNYDRLFEEALGDVRTADGVRKKPVVSSYSNQRDAVTKNYHTVKPTPDRPFIFKVHGDIEDASNSIVITDEDYILFIRRMITGFGRNDPIPETFRLFVQYWPILFIGYSLLDYNLRLLFKLMSWAWDESNPRNVRTSYAVGPRPDGLIREAYAPPVNFIVHDAWTFVPELYKAVKGSEMP